MSTSYPGAPSLGRLLQLINAVANQMAIDIYNLPALAAWIQNVSAGYLSNGVNSPVLVAGGSGYVTPVVTIPLPATAPSGAVQATMSVTNTGGVLSLPVMTNNGSGYGTSTPLVIVTDSGGPGAGAIITTAPINSDNIYNFSPSQVTLLQSFIAPMFNAIGDIFTGTVQSTAAINTFAIASGGASYSVNDILTITEGGLVGGQIKVATLGASNAVQTATLYAPGYNASTGTGLATTGGTGTGCTVNILTVVGIIRSGVGYNFQATIEQWTGFVTTN